MTKGKKRRTGKREPNGRLSRIPSDMAEAAKRNLIDLDAEQRATLSAGLEARERIWSVKPQHSRDQKAGSAIGRYCLQGLVTQAQYDAALLFIESNARNLYAIDAPREPGAKDLNATHGRPVTVDNPGQLRKWRQAHEAATRAIQDKQNEIRLQGNLYGAVAIILLRDVPMDHLLGDLRTALNALVRHYGLVAKVAA